MPLTTRLVVPRPAPDVISRPRLLRAVSDAIALPLALLAAPAGAGKSSLLSEWAHAGLAPGPVAWVSLDGERIDRRRFWTLVLASAERARGHEGAFQVQGSVDAALVTFLNGLAERREPLVLVLDDFQEIADRGVIADLDAVLDHPPDALRLVILSRRDPALRLSRLRIAGTLAEVRARDLAFTEEEGVAFLQQGLPALATDDALTLWRRTEGWVAGLRLAALTLRDHPDPRAFVADFAGDEAAVADYLISEVLDRQGPRQRDALLQISLVDAVCGELADALAGESGGRLALRRLAAENPMLEPIDGRSGWFRFHPLLRDLLRAELRSHPREEVAELHRRAAVWFAEQGSVRAAAQHALAGGDPGMASREVAHGWVELFLEGGVSTLRALGAALPSDAVLREPELALAAAAVHIEDGELAAAATALAAASDGAGRLPPERRVQFDVTYATVLLRRARLHGDLAEGLAAARSLMGDDVPAVAAPGLRALALAALGIAELWVGVDDRAVAHLEAARGAAALEGHRYVAALALAHVAILDSFAGHHRRAYDRALEAASILEEAGWLRTSAAAAAYTVLSGTHYLWDQPEAARLSLERAEEALEAAPERPLRAMLATNRVRVLAMLGELDAAQATLRFERLALGDFEHPQLDAILDAQEGLLLDALGERDEARASLAASLARRDTPEVRVALARLRLSDGDPDGSIELLRPVVSGTNPGRLLSTRVQAHALRALGHDALLDHDVAATALEQALDLAEPRGLRRMLSELGPGMRPVLRRQIRRETAHRALVAELLEGLEGSSAARRGTPHPVEPLSERETVVLRYLPTMMSNHEIAGELYVSVNTVKTHLKQIYRKLDVVSRRDAVERGRSMGLLAPAPSLRRGH